MVRMSGLRVPGPVLGLFLLLVLLNVPMVQRHVASVANGILAHLSLLFVPVGVGVMTYFDQVARFSLQIGITLVISTWLALAASALVFRRLVLSQSGINENEGNDV